MSTIASSLIFPKAAAAQSDFRRLRSPLQPQRSNHTSTTSNPPVCPAPACWAADVCLKIHVPRHRPTRIAEKPVKQQLRGYLPGRAGLVSGGVWGCVSEICSREVVGGLVGCVWAAGSIWSPSPNIPRQGQWRCPSVCPRIRSFSGTTTLVGRLQVDRQKLIRCNSAKPNRCRAGATTVKLASPVSHPTQRPRTYRSTGHQALLPLPMSRPHAVQPEGCKRP